MPLRSVLLSAGLVLIGPSVRAQTQLASLASVPGANAAAGTFDETYRELMALAPVAERTAEVRNLVLRRDAATFTLQEGRLYQLTPIGGRTVGLVYVGKGQFAFAPASRIEQDRLERLEKVRALDVPVSAVFFLFADSTLAQLEKSLTFVPGNSARRRPQERQGRPQVPGRRGQPHARSRHHGRPAQSRDQRPVLRPHHAHRRQPAHVPAQPGRAGGGAAADPGVAPRLGPASGGDHPVRPAGRRFVPGSRPAIACARRTCGSTPSRPR